jgi:hypothetical protein
MITRERVYVTLTYVASLPSCSECVGTEFYVDEIYLEE